MTVMDRIKILLVEDDEDDFVIIRDTLSDIKRQRFDLKWVKSYDEALKKVGEVSCSVCLVDYFLGDRNGIDLIEEFIRKGFREPIIILTGQGDYDLDILAMKKGAVDYLDKNNLDPLQLERSIRYALRHSEIINELKQSETKLRHLSVKILEAQEKERALVARELHDGVGASLTAVKYALEMGMHSMKKAERAPEGNSFEKVIEMVDDAIEETRRISSNLRPASLDTLGLIPAIRSLGREFQELYQDIQLESRINLQEKDIPEKQKIVLYRIVQEALNNISKHSGADSVRFDLRLNEGRVELLVQDNGRGFSVDEALAVNPGKSGMGLDGMLERVMLSDGNIEIQSEAGKGTSIRADFPIS
jgi:signal transduction histidine kinase